MHKLGQKGRHMQKLPLVHVGGGSWKQGQADATKGQDIAGLSLRARQRSSKRSWTVILTPSPTS